MLKKLGIFGSILSGLAGLVYLVREVYIDLNPVSLFGWFILLLFIGFVTIVIHEKYKEVKNKVASDIGNIQSLLKQNQDDLDKLSKKIESTEKELRQSIKHVEENTVRNYKGYLESQKKQAGKLGIEPRSLSMPSEEQQ